MLLCSLLLACTVPPSAHSAAAVGGQLELRDWSPETGPVLLTGEWAFVSGALLSPGEPVPPVLSPGLWPVPQAWDTPQGLGTYRLEVLLPTDAPPLQLTFTSIAGASQIWVDGVLLLSAGHLGPTLAETREDLRHMSGVFTPPSDGRVEIVAQVANAHHRIGGIHKPVVLSTPAQASLEAARRVGSSVGVMAAMATLGLGFLALFGYRPREQVHLYFGLFCLVLASRDVLGGQGELALLVWPDMPWSLRIRLEYLTLPLGGVLGVGMMALIARQSLRSRLVRATQALNVVFVVATLLSPLTVYKVLLPLDQLVMLWTIGVCLLLMLRGARDDLQAVQVPLLFGMITGLAFVHDTLVSVGSLRSPVQLAVPGFLSLLAIQGLLLVREFARSLGRIEALADALQVAHDDLTATHRAILRFVPTQFLRLLGRATVAEIERGDHARLEMSILFCDLRSFTTLIETLGPERAFPFINRYLRFMEPAITTREGFISQYLGDAIMALFPGSADNAVQAALEMVQALAAFNAVEPEGTVSFGIGIGSGPLMLGAIGGIDRLDGSVIGDAVNQASRIEGMTKMYGVTLLLDESTVVRLARPEDFTLREVDRVISKGRQTASTIYEVLDALPPLARQLRHDNLPRWHAAREAWCAGDFALARRGFEACLRLDPDDAPARLYIQRCDRFIEEGAPPDWDGILRLQQKS